MRAALVAVAVIAVVIAVAAAAQAEAAAAGASTTHTDADGPTAHDDGQATTGALRLPITASGWNDAPDEGAPSLRPAARSLSAPSLRCDELSGARPSPSACARVLDYAVLSDDPAVSNTTCLAYSEQKAAALPTMWAMFPQPCRSAVALLTCALTHTRCEAPVRPPCASLCNNIALYCGPAAASVAAALTAQGFPANCSRTPYTLAAAPHCNPGPDTLSIAATDAQRIANPTTTVTPAIPVCEAYTGTVCASTLGPGASVYVPAGLAQSGIEATVRLKYAWLFNLAPRALGCNTAFAQYICAQAFMPCTTAFPMGPSGPATVLPRPLCQNNCRDFAAKCQAAGLFVGMPTVRPNCTSVGTLFKPLVQCNGRIEQPATQFDFPLTAAAFPGGLLSRCNDHVSDEFGANRNSNWVPFATASCPAPLVFPDDLDSKQVIQGGLCAPPCPMLAFTDDQYSTADALITVVVVLSFVLSAFTLLSWVIDPSRRNQRYIVLFIFFTLLLAFWQLVGIIVSRAGGLRHLAQGGCATNTDLASIRNARTNSRSMWIAILGTIQVYNIQAIVFWWMINSIDLFLKVVLNLRVVYPTRQWKIKEAIFCSIGFGVPLLFTALCVGFGLAGATNLGVAWVSVHTSPDPRASTAETNLDWWVFFLPVLVSCAVGMLCWTATMAKFVASTRATGASASGAASATAGPGAGAAGSSRARQARGCKHYSRAITFLLVCFSIFAVTFAFRSYSEHMKPAWNRAAKAWVTCLLVTKPLRRSMGQLDYECPESAGGRPLVAPNFGFWLLFQAAISGLGLVSFVVYGTVPNNLLLDRLARALPCLPCLDRCRIRNGADFRASSQRSGATKPSAGEESGKQRLQTAGAGGTPSAALTTASHKRQSVNRGSGGTPAALPMPVARRPSTSATPSHSRGNSAQTEVDANQLRLRVTSPEEGDRRKDVQPASASVRFQRGFANRSVGSASAVSPTSLDTPLDNDGDGDESPSDRPGLSIRVSLPKPLPHDSVFAAGHVARAGDEGDQQVELTPIVPAGAAASSTSAAQRPHLPPLSISSGSPTNAISSSVAVASPSATTPSVSPLPRVIRVHRVASPSASSPPPPTPVVVPGYGAPASPSPAVTAVAAVAASSSAAAATLAAARASSPSSPRRHIRVWMPSAQRSQTSGQQSPSAAAPMLPHSAQSPHSPQR